MGKAIRASVLVLLLACSAQAGWIQNESPTSQANTAQETAAEGGTQNDVTDDLTQTALVLLALLPKLP
jgi:hypothetical protein